MVAKFFEARIFAHDASKHGFHGRKICYRTQVGGTQKVPSILAKLLPYLVIKKRNAEIILELVGANKHKNILMKNEKGQVCRNTVIPDERERREKLYNEMVSLHNTRND